MNAVRVECQPESKAGRWSRNCQALGLLSPHQACSGASLGLALFLLSQGTIKPYEAGAIIVPILQMRKPRLKDISDLPTFIL
jgi:hypothetical protein